MANRHHFEIQELQRRLGALEELAAEAEAREPGLPGLTLVRGGRD